MSRIGDYFKRVGRKAIPIHEKYITRYARPAVTAALSYTFSPVVGEAFNYATQPAHYGVAKITQRAEGQHGLRASQRARAQASRTTMYGHAAAGIGAVASGITSLAVGGNFFTGAAFGQGGTALLTSQPTLFTPALMNLGELGTPLGSTAAVYGSQLSGDIITAGDLGAQIAKPVPGIVTASSLAGQPASSVPGLVTTVNASPAATGGSIWGDLAKTVGTAALGKVVGPLLEGRIPGQHGGGNGGAFPGGGGGDVPGAGGSIMDWLGGKQAPAEAKDNTGLLIAAGLAILFLR